MYICKIHICKLYQILNKMSHDISEFHSRDIDNRKRSTFTIFTFECIHIAMY